MAKDPYLYPHSDVLINRLGITNKATLERIETELVESRIKELLAAPLPGNFDQKHLEGIHEYLFKDVYFMKGEHVPAFAGAVRIIGISKETDIGITYPHPEAGIESLKGRLDYAFSELGKENHLTGMEGEPERFSTRLAKHAAEIWECHSFRDGNTRATFLFTEHLAKAAGFPFREGLDAASTFRSLIADYVRGDRAPFIEQISNYLAPARELSVVRSPVNHIEEQGGTYDVQGGDSSDRGLADARKVLNDAAMDFIRRKDLQFARSLEPMMARATQVEQQIASHEKAFVKKGLFSSKQAVGQWNAEKVKLENELRRAGRDITTAREAHQNRSLHHQHEAQQHANGAFPQEAALLRQHEVRVSAENLVDRWRSLEKELLQITSGKSPSHSNQKTFLRQSMAQVFGQIGSSSAIRDVLGKELVSRIQEASKVNSQAMETENTRERGIDLSR